MTALIFAMAALVSAPGSGLTDTFERANAAYKAGDFPTAIKTFEQLVGEHVENPAVFYNLANAYYRSGKLGLAIANYERALQLDPGLDNAQRNLSHCVDETKQHLARPLAAGWEQGLLFWHYRLRPDITRALALVFWVALWALLGLLQYRRVRYLKGVAALTGILALAFGASAWAKSASGTLAVTVSETAKVRYATDDKSTVRFELHEGDRVSVDRRERGWARVKTAGGETGWTQESDLFFVGPPYESAMADSATSSPQTRSMS